MSKNTKIEDDATEEQTEVVKPKKVAAKPVARKVAADVADDFSEDEESLEDLDAGEEEEDTAPVAKPKKKVTKETQALLDKIREESERRVNYDNFLHDQEDGKNKYDVPEHLIPEGFTIEWKNTHVMGQPVAASELAAHEQAGWRPAPADLFREILPEGYDKVIVERDGMILMIRPSAITDRFRRMERKNAKMAMQNKVDELNATKDGQMDRVVQTHKTTREARVAVADD